MPHRRIPSAASPAHSDSTFCLRRAQELARLVTMWPKEIEDLSIAGRRKLVAALWRALKAERQRGRHGHWAYDLARHADLYRAWNREQEALRQMILSQGPPRPKVPPTRTRA